MKGNNIVMDATRTLRKIKNTSEKTMNIRTQYSYCTTQELTMNRFIDSIFVIIIVNILCVLLYYITITAILSKTIVVVILIIIPIIIFDNLFHIFSRKIWMKHETFCTTLLRAF